MRLVPKSKLYGQPAIRVRDFLRHIGPGTFDVEYLRGRMGLSKSEAAAVLSGLLEGRLIEAALRHDGGAMYDLTWTGRTLAISTFAHKIPREQGERLLASVVARASDMEAQLPFAYRVKRIALFGSMLTEAELVHDVDLAVALEPKFEDDEFEEAKGVRVDVALRAGKRFRSRLEAIVWPHVEVIEYLRGGSRHVSLNGFAELRVLGAPSSIVYQSSN